MLVRREEEKNDELEVCDIDQNVLGQRTIASSSLSITVELENPLVAVDSPDDEAELLRQYLERALGYANDINKLIDPDWGGWKIKVFRKNPSMHFNKIEE